MPFQPCPGIAQVEFRCSFGGQDVENVIHWDRHGTWDLAELQALASGLINVWAVEVLALQSSLVTLREVYVKDLTEADGLEVTEVPPSALPGALSGDALPNNCALAVSLRTDRQGRSNRGRLYHYGFVETQVTHNTVAANIVTAITQAYQAIQAFFGAPGAWCVLSRYSGGDLREYGVGTDITAVVCRDATMDSMRRRLPGRGR